MEAGVILCIDDERIVLNGLQAQLSRDFGTTYSIEIAESGEEAFEIIEELLSKGIAIPVVISDELMPGIKGHELLTKIHIKSPATYTILLTGQSDLYAVTEAVNNANLYRYIAKPWDGNDLLLTVREAIKGFYQDRQLAEQNILLERHNKNLEQLVEERTQQLLAEKGKNDELVQRELQYARSIQEGLLPPEPQNPYFRKTPASTVAERCPQHEKSAAISMIYISSMRNIFFSSSRMSAERACLPPCSWCAQLKLCVRRPAQRVSPQITRLVSSQGSISNFAPTIVQVNSLLHFAVFSI